MAVINKIGTGDPRSTGRRRRHSRVRKNLAGTAARPRLAVFRSSRQLVAQVIDDADGRTLASASTMEPDLRNLDGDKSAKATRVGELVAERAKSAGVSSVVFDRGGFRYAGRVAALAQGARDAGLNF